MFGKKQKNAPTVEIVPSSLAVDTRALTKDSDGKKISTQLAAERRLLSNIRKYRDIAEDQPDFGPLDQSEQERYWRVLWNVMDSKNPTNMARDKKLTMDLLKKIQQQKFRYVGQRGDGTRLFLSQSGTITKPIGGRASLTVVWPSIGTLRKDGIECETRIQYLRRLLGERSSGESKEQFSEN